MGIEPFLLFCSSIRAVCWWVMASWLGLWLNCFFDARTGPDGVENSWWAVLAISMWGFTRPPSLSSLLGLVKFVAGRDKELVVFSSSGWCPVQEHTALPSSQGQEKMLWNSQILKWWGGWNKIQADLLWTALVGPWWFPNTCSPSQNMPSFCPGMSHAAWNLTQNRAGLPPRPPLILCRLSPFF